MNDSQNHTLLDSKKTLLGIVTMAITAGIVIVALMLGRSSQIENDITTLQQTDSDGPEQCVQRMLESAQMGDIDSYFACFSNDLQDVMKKKSAIQSTKQFASELRKREAALKTFVAKDLEFLSLSEATLELERMYADHNTRHRVRLKLISDEWKIIELIPLEQYTPKIPFGTPVVPGLEGGPKSRTSRK